MGGWTPEHSGHETGLDVDIRLPRNNGTAGGITIASSNYDQATARAICEAFSSLPDTEVSNIYFNDNAMNNNAQAGNRIPRVTQSPGHHNHIHVDVESPNDPIPDYNI